MCNRQCTTEIDKSLHFILKKLYVSNLALGLIYCDMLESACNESNYLDHFEESKKYVNGAIETAGSPTERAAAIFRRSELHLVLFNISLVKVLPSSEETNLIVYLRIFLESLRDSLQILHDANNEDDRLVWLDYFQKSFNTIDILIACFTIVGKSKIVDKLRHLVRLKF